MKEKSKILYDEMNSKMKNIMYIIVMKKNDVEVKKKENIRVIS